jgi:hypothetical protein
MSKNNLTPKSDWTGNNKAIYSTLGASNHSKEEREENDYYATDPNAMRLLLEEESFNKNIWEPACGENHLTNVLREHGYIVRTSDLIQRTDNVEQLDFLSPTNNTKWNGDIITNPPYSYAAQFAEKALSLLNDGNKLAMFLKIQFLEGQSRRELFRKNPPKIVYVSTNRILCAKNGKFDGKEGTNGGAVCYCWFIWEKGFNGDPIIKWFNDGSNKNRNALF